MIWDQEKEALRGKKWIWKFSFTTSNDAKKTWSRTKVDYQKSFSYLQRLITEREIWSSTILASSLSRNQNHKKFDDSLYDMMTDESHSKRCFAIFVVFFVLINIFKKPLFTSSYLSLLMIWHRFIASHLFNNRTTHKKNLLICFCECFH